MAKIPKGAFLQFEISNWLKCKTEIKEESPDAYLNDETIYDIKEKMNEINDQSLDLNLKREVETNDASYDFETEIKEEPLDTCFNDDIAYDIKPEINDPSSNLEITFGLKSEVETSDGPLDYLSFAEHSGEHAHLNLKNEMSLDAHSDPCQIEQEIHSQEILADAVEFQNDRSLLRKNIDDIFIQKIQDSKFPVVLVKKLTFKKKDLAAVLKFQNDEGFLKKNKDDTFFQKIQNSNFPFVLVKKLTFKSKRNIFSDNNLSDVGSQEKKSEQKPCNPGRDSSQRKVGNSFLCPNCQYRTYSQWKLGRHMMTHSSIKLFKCSYCDHECNRKQNMDNHILTHSKKNWFKCLFCSYETNNKFSLKRHLLSHSNRRFKCTLCGHQNNSKYWFFDHLIRHEDSDLITEFSIGFNSSLLKCFLCSYEAPDKSQLSAHLSRHAKKRWMSCSTCDYQTIDRSSLKRHLLCHASSKLLKCSECEYETNDSGHLKRHGLRHSKVKLYKCTNCRFETNYKKQLNKHMNNNHSSY